MRHGRNVGHTIRAQCSLAAHPILEAVQKAEKNAVLHAEVDVF